jgi:hypothetical protein
MWVYNYIVNEDENYIENDEVDNDFGNNIDECENITSSANSNILFFVD